MNNRDPLEVYKELRDTALNAVSLGMQKPPAEHSDVYGMVIDIPQGGGYATLVAMADSSTSMYISNGGGIIGAGQHAEVAKASQSLLVRAQHCMSDFIAESTHNLPQAGTVRFHLLTEKQNLCLNISEDQFWGKTTLTGKQFPMIMAIQQLISTIQSAEKRATK